MRIIGIDLAVRGAHKAMVADETGQYVSKLLTFHTDVHELEKLLSTARPKGDQETVKVIMEPTGMAWFPIAVYFARQKNVITYLVNTQQVADLRRFYKRHAKSDRIDCRLLAKLPLINGDNIHELVLSGGQALACQRGSRQLVRLEGEMTALKNRMRAIDRFAWPGLEELVFTDVQSPSARWFRQYWYHPVKVLNAGATTIQKSWQEAQIAPNDMGDWIEPLVCLAERIVALYGRDNSYLDYDLLQEEILREQVLLIHLEQTSYALRMHTVRKLYRTLHPSRHLETIKGVGQDSAAVYVSGIDDPHRFSSNRTFRGWHGLIPDSRQSGNCEGKGLHITKAGPNLIKKYAYLDADVARQWDPQIAAIYYDQMVNKGKHHNQAVCVCATHLMDRVLAVMREDRPYQLRDTDGSPVTVAQARTIIANKYKVSEEIRSRRNKSKRKERADKSAEKRENQKESRGNS